MKWNELLLQIMGVNHNPVIDKPYTYIDVLRKLFVKHLPVNDKVRVNIKPYQLYVYQDKYYINMPEPVEITDLPYDVSKPPFTPTTPVIVHSILGIKDNTEIKLGRLIKYVIVNLEGFKGDVPYEDKNMSVKDYDKYILNGLNKHFITYSNSVKYLSGLSTTLNQASDASVITPVKGVYAFRDKEAKKLDLSDPLDVVKLEAKVTDYIKEGLKDSSVAQNNFNKTLGRYIKLNGMFGSEAIFGGELSKTITRSLSEGLPTDADTMATALNISRSGSDSRGSKVATGGVIFSLLSVVASGLDTVDKACDTNELLRVWCEDQEQVDLLVKDRYTNDSKGNPIRIVDKGYDREYLIRSPVYCRTHGDYCKYCMGDKIANTPQGITQGVGVISRVIIGASMKAMHGVKVESVKMKSVTELF